MTSDNAHDADADTAVLAVLTESQAVCKTIRRRRVTRQMTTEPVDPRDLELITRIVGAEAGGTPQMIISAGRAAAQHPPAMGAPVNDKIECR